MPQQQTQNNRTEFTYYNDFLDYNLKSRNENRVKDVF